MGNNIKPKLAIFKIYFKHLARFMLKQNRLLFFGFLLKNGYFLVLFEFYFTSNKTTHCTSSANKPKNKEQSFFSENLARVIKFCLIIFIQLNKFKVFGIKKPFIAKFQIGDYQQSHKRQSHKRVG